MEGKINQEAAIMYLLFKQYIAEGDETFTFQEWLIKTGLTVQPVLHDLEKLWRKHGQS